MRQQRACSPVFDVIIELRPKLLNEWTIVFGVDRAVDKILSNEKYLAQVRSRDVESGLTSLELVDA